MTRRFPRTALLAAVLAGSLAALLARPVRADEVDLPGLDTESAAFAATLAKPFPAGGTRESRSQAEARAATAAARNDWSAAALALEARLGQSDPTPALWLLLSEAELRRATPDPRRSVDAAWQSYQAADEAEDKASAMAAAAQALLAQGRPAQAGQALAQAVALAPANAGYKQRLAAANRAAGLLVVRVRTEPDADPPRACIVFNLPLSRRNDFHPEDWVHLDPPMPDAAITREGDGLCISGLPLAATTRAILHQGLPADSPPAEAPTGDGNAGGAAKDASALKDGAVGTAKGSGAGAAKDGSATKDTASAKDGGAARVGATSKDGSAPKDSAAPKDPPAARDAAAGAAPAGALAMKAETVVALAMGSRSPLLAFDSRMFLLPRGQAPRIVLTSSNVSAVKLAVVLFTERTLLPWTLENPLGKPMESYLAGQLGSDQARVVWSGKATLPGFVANARLHTVLPLPADAMRAPGLYAVTVQPDDGQATGVAEAVQPVLQTDLAPTIWRGADGLAVQVRGYSDAAPRPGVALRLMAHDNDILAEARTDADGMAHFAAPLLHGAGAMAPAAIQATLAGPPGTQDDFVSLDLGAAAFDLSDRGVTGASQPGPIDAFVWSDRGIYRPGETVQLMALLRDAGGLPVDRPAHLRIRRPNSTVFSDTVVQPGGGGSLHLAATLSNGAPAGAWTAQVFADPDGEPLGEVSFKVDAFVPDRMAVQLATLPAQLVPGGTQPVSVNARFLYGAPAAHLTGNAEIRLEVAPAPDALAGYQVGLTDEAFAPQATTLTLPPTDDAGNTTLPLRLAAAPDTTHPIQAALDVSVDDPSGHAAHATATLPVRPAGTLIGIRPAFDGSVDAGAEAAFDIASLDPDGRRGAMPVRLRLVRERPDWRLVASGSLASYETVWRDEPLETHDLTIPADGTLHFARTLEFGRYRLEVTQPHGLAASSLRFRSGWASSDSPDVPDRADVSADRKAYPPGAAARIHVAAPFAGPATLLVMTDRVLSARNVEVPAGGADFDVPVDAAWGPGAYVAVHVFRGGTTTTSTRSTTATTGASRRPDRAIGLAWLGIDPAARRLDVAFEAPDVAPPRATAHVRLHTAPGAWVSIAAVDEGILRLTGYATPDAGPHYLGRRSLGVDIRDDWGRLIAPAEGTAAALRQGGDEAASGHPNIPQRIVSLFLPPAQADASGTLDVALPFPDFNGQVRLMAMAWDANRLGSTAADLFVRDPLVAEPLLPRYLAPGDLAQMAVLLQNVSLPEGPATVRVTTDGPLALQADATPTTSGATSAATPATPATPAATQAAPAATTPSATLAATLAPGAQATPTLMLRATGSGLAHVTLDVSGPGGFHAQHVAALDIHPVRGLDSVVSAGELPPGATATLAPQTAAFVDGTWTASATFGAPVRYDAGALVRALDAYPLLCLEQAASKGLPLVLLPDGAVAGPDRALRLQHAVDTVLDRQRYDGAFGLWAASDDAEPWLSAYATEFLLRARKAGASVGDAAIANALTAQLDPIGNPGSDAEGQALQAYRLYIAGLAGQPRAGAGRILFESLDTLPTPLARAQLGMALALGNDRPRAEQAFAAALASPGRKPWDYDYGDATRDAAAVALLLKESGLLPDRLAALVARLPGADTRPAGLDTQQEAWLAAVAGALGRDGTVTRITLDGHALPPSPVIAASLTVPVTARNTGDRPVWQSLSASGVPAQAPPAGHAGMRISRRFFNADGSVLDLSHLRQNMVFVLLLEGTADDGQPHRAQLLQGLPAGWEIAGRLAAGEVAGMPWLGTLSDTLAMPAADDRFQAVMDLSADQPGFRIAVRLRAVTPGRFEMPGAELSDMYRPAVFARQGDNTIDVQPPQ